MRENIELRIEQKLSCKTSLLLAQSCRATKFNNGWTRNCSISSRKTVIVTDEEMYGNKQIISITPRIYDYTLQNVHKPQNRSPDFLQLCALYAVLVLIFVLYLL
ncbi:uncharacterized protein LOC123195886 isoform X2 [Mangifera indica]|uniref:uncharacterized protein LOC123195886 isoform X2 n=1 Tax=Mangifera indica TaxID=29780 RepID=UPI001CFA6D52|nr:uncharacterized protein LOC123195886 isoform X2 [Mangifera indica]